ncbi:hypothetical protein B0O99DRAFT_526729 [Bisporella sp. PMI_857]|nr:hypothetical protein B0O99DRAFT_526729 [Bisporella sp. PMI_857]
MILPRLVLISTFVVTGFAASQVATIQFTPAPSSLQLVSASYSPSIRLDYKDWPGVIRTAQDLAQDFGRVTGRNGSVYLTNSTAAAPSSPVIIAGTIGNSSLIDGLIAGGKISVSNIKGKWESYSSQLVLNPISGVSVALVIAGSDKRGTIYGLYDVSQQIGVSPWYWWADVPTIKRTVVYAVDVIKIQGPPSVKYRGIFLNDEAPALTGWIRANYPNGVYGLGFNSQFYSKVFELLLRLRANYLWPAMWSSMFYADDANNGPTADMFGIVMGTSHTEPMARATNEEGHFLTGEWDWVGNTANVKAFMKDGVQRAKTWDTLWTMGMRGAGDTASPTLDAPTLETIINYQKTLLQQTLSVTDVSKVPKMWCLYKEVGGYFQAGLTVPEDITLLWTDDNNGNLLRVPLSNETNRAAGAGVYYHFDYVGSPRNYKWINSIQLAKTWEQMHLAYERNARQIWIVNVGDLKPLEIPINHFLDMAYDMASFGTPASTDEWLKSWATRQFGSSVGDATAAVISTYGKLIIRRKYEQLSTTPFALSVANYDEAEKVLQEWTTLLSTTQKLYDSLNAATQVPFFEMVLHPVLAGKTVQEIYIKAALNAWYARQHRTSTNALASQVVAAFAADASISARYNGLLNGKWNHMMDQVHLGYTSWNDPAANTMPSVSYVSSSTVPTAGIMGVSIQGSDTSVPGDPALTIIPVNPYMPSSDYRYIDIFTRNNGSFAYSVTSNVSYVTVSPSSGTISSSGISDVRANISVNWALAPAGLTYARISVSGTGINGTTLTLPVNKTSVPSTFKGFVESNGVIAFEAEHYQSVTPGLSASYMMIPGYGRTVSGVTLSPVTCPSQTTSSGPKLSYNFHVFTAQTAKISIYFGSSLNVDPTRPLQYALSLDGGVVSTVQPVPSTNLGTVPSGWTDAVNRAGWTSNIYRTMSAGSHTLDIWILEPGLVIQRLVIDIGGVQASYLGPPESLKV